MLGLRLCGGGDLQHYLQGREEQSLAEATVPWPKGPALRAECLLKAVGSNVLKDFKGKSLLKAVKAWFKGRF